MRQDPLSERLQDAVLDELDTTADLIDAGLPTFSRVRILGCAADFRLPVLGLDAPDTPTYIRLLGGAIWSALLLTAGKGFVLAFHNPFDNSFVVYGVTSTSHVGVTASLSAPFDDASAKAVTWDRDCIAQMRTWIPAAVTDHPSPQFLDDLDDLLGAGGKHELRQLGPVHSNVCIEWGTA